MYRRSDPILIATLFGNITYVVANEDGLRPTVCYDWDEPYEVDAFYHLQPQTRVREATYVQEW